MVNPPFSQRALELVGDADPLAILASTPDAVRKLIHDHDEAALRAQPAPEKWAPVEIIGHLLDHEIVMAYRLRRVLHDPDAVIEGYPQEDWVRGLDHASRDPDELFHLFAILRRECIHLWSSIPATRFEESFTRDSGEVQTLSLMRIVHAGHDLAHLDQLRRYLGA